MTDNKHSNPQTQQPSKPQATQASAGNKASNEAKQSGNKTAPAREPQKQDKPAGTKQS